MGDNSHDSDLGTVRIVDGQAYVIDGSGNVHDVKTSEVPELVKYGFKLVDDAAQRSSRVGGADAWPPPGIGVAEYGGGGGSQPSPTQIKTENPEAFGMDDDFGDAGRTRGKMDEVVDHRAAQSNALKSLAHGRVSVNMGEPRESKLAVRMGEPKEVEPSVELSTMPVKGLTRSEPKAELDVVPAQETHRKGPDGESWMSYDGSDPGGSGFSAIGSMLADKAAKKAKRK